MLKKNKKNGTISPEKNSLIKKSFSATMFFLSSWMKNEYISIKEQLVIGSKKIRMYPIWSLVSRFLNEILFGRSHRKS